jgi:hypothetical protein
MSEFRKKAIVIKATQWFKNGDHPLDACDGSENEGEVVRRYNHPEDLGSRACNKCGRKMFSHGWIDTPEGGAIVCPGDWIITGIKGEMYPCKPNIFAITYGEVTS